MCPKHICRPVFLSSSILLSICPSFLRGPVRPFKALCLSLRHPLWSGPLFSAASTRPSANACSFSAVLSPPLCLRRRPELTSVAAKWQRGGRPRGRFFAVTPSQPLVADALLGTVVPTPKVHTQRWMWWSGGPGWGRGPGGAAALPFASFLSLHFYVHPSRASVCQTSAPWEPINFCMDCIINYFISIL